MTKEFASMVLVITHDTSNQHHKLSFTIFSNEK
jgi:hypothetical protein